MKINNIMTDFLLQISEKIINLFDISIVIFEKKENNLQYIYANDFFRKNNKEKYNTNNRLFGYLFPEFDNDEAYNKINKSIEKNTTETIIIDKKTKLDIYSIDSKYIIFCKINNCKTDKIKSEKTRALLNNMNHSIRTPLNNITGLIDLLLETEITNEQSKYIYKIQESCFMLINIITDLLDFLKLETKNMVLYLEKFNLEEIIDSCINIIQKKANNKNLEIHKIIHPNIYKYRIGDIRRIKQIILNILDNAVKFTNNGYIKIEVLEENELTIKLSDTGIGMKKKDVEQLFKTEEDDGKNEFGLGLLIAKYLIDLMGGNINVKSKYKVGTTFTIKLPLEKYINKINKIETINNNILIILNDLNKRINIGKMLMLSKINPILCSSIDEGIMYMKNSNFDLVIIDNEEYIRKIDGKKLLISKNINRNLSNENTIIIKETYNLEKLKELIIEIINTPKKTKKISILHTEDEKINRLVSEKLLDNLGFINYKSVKNGIEAYNELKHNKYDILLLDIKMPLKNGFELIDDLKRENIKIPYVIVTTGYITDDIKKQCDKRNINDILYKPIYIEDLQIALQRAKQNIFNLDDQE